MTENLFKELKIGDKIYCYKNNLEDFNPNLCNCTFIVYSEGTNMRSMPSFCLKIIKGVVNEKDALLFKWFNEEEINTYFCRATKEEIFKALI